MTTEIDIANRSLLGVGARATISSFNPSDGSAEGDAISILWTPTFEALGRTANWNCLRKSTTLDLLAAAQGTPENPGGTIYPIPEFPWLYAYALPSDCLRFNYVVPSNPVGVAGGPPETTISNSAATWLPSGGQIPFVVTSSLDSNNNPVTIILTNQDQAVGVYIANIPNPGVWDSLFQAAMVASLGAFLVPALSMSMSLLDRCVKLAEMAITIARTADGNEGVTVMDHTPDWFRARAGAQGYGNFWNNGFLNFNQFDDMVWPGP